MLSTTLKIFRLPEKYRKSFEYTYVGTTYYNASIYMAKLRGETNAPCHNVLNVPSLPPHDMREVTLVTSDGSEVRMNRSTLCLLFTFFDDYLNEFPDEDRIDIPYSKDEIESIRDIRLLIDCYEALCYFNPKDPIYYFVFNTRGLSDSILLELTSRLTLENRREILEARRLSNKCLPPLPREGEGNCILAALLETHCDFESLVKLFRDYPSYLVTMALVYGYRDDELDRELLLTSDFSYDIDPRLHYQWPLTKRIYRLMKRCTKWDDVKRCLTMLELRHSIFGNEGEFIILPYHMRPDLRSFFIGMRVSKLVSTIHPYLECDRDALLQVVQNIALVKSAERV